MKPFHSFLVNPINPKYHTEDNFREQMAVLYVAGDVENPILDNLIKMVRSFISIGTPHMSGFDSDFPGQDTEDGWKVLDNLIEEHHVRGTFHTHPPGVRDFSEQDILSIKGLAKANGSMPIWHGVQSVDYDHAHFVCARMICGHVQFCDFSWIKSDLNDPVLLLPSPPVVGRLGDVSVLNFG